MTPAHKIVIDEFAGVPTREPVAPVTPANDNDGKTPLQRYVDLVRQDPTCICEQINDLDREGLLYDIQPPLRCPIHERR